MYHSKNAIVRNCFNHTILDANLCIDAKLDFLQTIGVAIFKQTLCGAIKQVTQLIENLRNYMRSEQPFIESFDNTEIDCMIQYITGHL